MSQSNSNYGCCSFNPWPHIGEMHKKGLDGLIEDIFGSSSSSSASGAAITEKEFVYLVCNALNKELEETDTDADCKNR